MKFGTQTLVARFIILVVLIAVSIRTMLNFRLTFNANVSTVAQLSTKGKQSSRLFYYMYLRCLNPLQVRYLLKEVKFSAVPTNFA